MDDKERPKQPWGNEDEQPRPGEGKSGFGKGASEDDYPGDKSGAGGGGGDEFGDDPYVGGKADYGGDKSGAE